jgi:hypothetical protein
MILVVFCSAVVVLLVVSGVIKSESRESSMHIINAKWLDNTDKFRLVSRWGIKG